ncbi:MAG: hypothetical protein O3A66_01990, partial [Proteobacteria bacterium]|nr:hypothetical protein [Pseudomonadota bacterium]
DKIIIEYHAKGYPRCMSFVTKYLFWSVYAFADNHDDYKNFFIYDRLVARKIKLSTPTSNVGFYKKWHGKMQKIKEKNGFKDNREMDLELWSNQKATETEQRKKTKLTHVPNK